jgi:WG containing repeat
MHVRCLTVATLVTLAFEPHAQAQDRPVELTAAGKAILEAKLATDGGPLYDRPGPEKPIMFPLAMCAFPGGLCGAVCHDGSVAVPPRYDWVGTFSDGRAAVRSSGLYGFVDEHGHEIVPPHYRIVGDYKFGFAQVDMDGKSGLIDRDGRLVIEPKFGFVEAVAPDRFRASETRQPGGMIGAEDFSGASVEFRWEGGRILGPPDASKSGIIDRTGQWIEPPGNRIFDPDDRSIRIVSEDNLWGLRRANGSWLARPQFNQAEALSDGLARVRVSGRIGFIDRSGRFVIDPVFDEAWAFTPGFARTSVRQGKSVRAIDRTGAWVFRIDADGLYWAVASARTGGAPFGWHFQREDRWGLLDLDGHVLLDAEFDQAVQRCVDGHLVAFKDREWLYFRSDGSPLRPPVGRIVDADCGTLAPYIVKAGDKFGLVDGDGKEITPPAFDALISATRDSWNAKLDGKWGRIGRDGHWLFEPKFDYLSRSNPIIVAATDAKHGLLKADGSWLVEPRFDDARARDSETAFVTMDGTSGVIRVKDQSWAVAPRPGVMCDIPYGILSQSEGRRAIFSRSGAEWIDARVDRLGIDLETGLLPFLRDGKWGLMDTAGKVAILPIYDEQVSFRPSFRGIAWAKHDGRWCPIDRHGQDVPGIACIERSPSGEGGAYFKCAVEP